MVDITIYSYGAKHNEPALRSLVMDRVYSCHLIVNPYSRGMRMQTGLDDDVQSLVWSDEDAKKMYRQALKDVEHGARTVAFECYGGRHRSVAMAEFLASALREWPEPQYNVRLIHLSLGRY